MNYGDIFVVDFFLFIDSKIISCTKESAEMQNYIRQACQLGLMGQNSSLFKPNDNITRAQFGTILSRALYGNKYEGGERYYTRHLEALKEKGIIKNTDPDLKETRGYVMLMLMRAKK